MQKKTQSTTPLLKLNCQVVIMSNFLMLTLPPPPPLLPGFGSGFHSSKIEEAKLGTVSTLPTEVGNPSTAGKSSLEFRTEYLGEVFVEA